MLRLLSDPIRGTWLAAAIIVVGAALSVCMHDFGVLARLGNALLCIIIIMLSRPAITRTGFTLDVMSADNGMNLGETEHYQAMGQEVPEYGQQSEINKLAVNRLSPILALAGTIDYWIWRPVEYLVALKATSRFVGHFQQIPSLRPQKNAAAGTNKLAGCVLILVVADVREFQ